MRKTSTIRLTMSIQADHISQIPMPSYCLFWRAPGWMFAI
jgi:hypothetical protein